MAESGVETDGGLERRTYAAPAIINIFLPGVGQMMKGQVGVGILILLVVILGWFSFALVFPPIVAVLVQIWSIASAYRNPAKEPS